MAVIDSNNFITHLVWSGLIDKATCGELKEAIELCTVKDIYTKADMVAMFKEFREKLFKWMFRNSESVCGNSMIDIDYLEGYMDELLYELGIYEVDEGDD